METRRRWPNGFAPRAMPAVNPRSIVTPRAFARATPREVMKPRSCWPAGGAPLAGGQSGAQQSTWRALMRSCASWQHGMQLSQKNCAPSAAHLNARRPGRRRSHDKRRSRLFLREGASYWLPRRLRRAHRAAVPCDGLDRIPDGCRGHLEGGLALRLNRDAALQLSRPTRPSYGRVNWHKPGWDLHGSEGPEVPESSAISSL